LVGTWEIADLPADFLICSLALFILMLALKFRAYSVVYILLSRSLPNSLAWRSTLVEASHDSTFEYITLNLTHPALLYRPRCHSDTYPAAYVLPP
jgi:hypothetical protein